MTAFGAYIHISRVIMQLKIFFLLRVIFTVNSVEQWQLTSCDREQGKMDSHISTLDLLEKTIVVLWVFTQLSEILWTLLSLKSKSPHCLKAPPIFPSPSPQNFCVPSQFLCSTYIHKKPFLLMNVTLLGNLMPALVS